MFRVRLKRNPTTMEKGGGGIGDEGEGEGKFRTPEAAKLSWSSDSMGRAIVGPRKAQSGIIVHLEIEKGGRS